MRAVLAVPCHRIHDRSCRTVPRVGFADSQDDSPFSVPIGEVISGKRARSRTSILSVHFLTYAACCIRADISSAHHPTEMTFSACSNIRPCLETAAGRQNSLQL